MNAVHNLSPIVAAHRDTPVLPKASAKSVLSSAKSTSPSRIKKTRQLSSNYTSYAAVYTVRRLNFFTL